MLHHHARSIAHYLKEIARGKQGARDLTRNQANDLMSQALADQLDPVSLGGFAIAMRIKGETPDELMGFVAAARRHLMTLPLDAKRPCVWLPTYNGGRKLPNLTPLLAQWLARSGLRVLVHGVSSDPARVTTRQLFEALGWPVCLDADAVAQAWSRQQPAFMPIEALNPPLSRILALRQTLGLRNPAHSVAKLLSPATLPGNESTHFRVVNHTHSEYADSLSRYLQLDGADAMLMRGTEGEPVADLRRAPALQCFRGGVPTTLVPQDDGGLAPLPEGFGDGRRSDLASTVAVTQACLAGQRPLFGPIQKQVDAVLNQLQAG